MKHLTILCCLLIFASCTDDFEDHQISCQNVNYGIPFSVEKGDQICFPDGNGFTVEVIEDQFCPCNALCIWEGELRVLVQTVDALDQKKLFRFGSSTYSNDPNIFDHRTITDFTFLYDGTPDALPDCDNDYDPAKVVLTITIE